MYILGIESSCDETAAAIVNENRQILSNVIYSQIADHREFGGVVPEIAARAHLDKIDLVVKKTLSDACIDASMLSAVAGTCGPGLIGGLVVGATFAKAISLSLQIPFIAINHIEAHALAVRLTEDVSFPYLLFLASGGHCQICIVHAIDEFQILGQTLDDSIGESFDKVAKMIGLEYPGGPAIEREAKYGNPDKFSLPRPLCAKHNLDFSFSGLKTAISLIVPKCNSTQMKQDLCASFQKTVGDVVEYKIANALKQVQNISTVVISGGVGANDYIRHRLERLCNTHGVKFCAPPSKLCTDNGAMIAWLGLEKYRKQRFNNLDFHPTPCWPLGKSIPDINI